MVVIAFSFDGSTLHDRCWKYEESIVWSFDRFTMNFTSLILPLRIKNVSSPSPSQIFLPNSYLDTGSIPPMWTIPTMGFLMTHSSSSARCQMVMGVNNESSNSVISFPSFTEWTIHSTNPLHDRLICFPTIVVRTARRDPSEFCRVFSPASFGFP